MTWLHTVNYRIEHGPPRGLANRGFWLHDLPRPLIICRLLGHRPVVDGTGPMLPHLRASRWVCCDRCGVRPHPQGRLDPDQHGIGDRYTGPFDGAPPPPLDVKAALRTGDLDAIRDSNTRRPPGPWPARPEWTLGGQLVIGAAHTGLGLQAKVGNAGSEEVLAGHIHLGRAFALYLHTERLGTWWQRRLNPVGYDSKVIDLSAHDGRLSWKFWALRSTSSRATPRWRDGSVRINPLDIALGPRRYSYTDVGEPVTATLRMPHGDTHTATLQLQRRTLARTRGRRRTQAWTVDCEIEAPGVPTKPHRGGVTGLGADVNADDVREGRWVYPALAAVAAQLTKDRARYDYTAG